MKSFAEILLYPIGRRLGTMAGSAALTYGATVDQSVAVETAVIFISGLAIDLVNSALESWGRR